MFTPDQMKALYTRVFDQMVKARWIHHYTFTDGKGFRPAWTAAGTERAVCLKKLSETYRLLSDDRAAYGFDKLAHGERLPSFVRPIELDDAIALYWRESIEQLGLRGDQDGLLIMVHIIEGWTPGLDTPLEFGGR